MINYRHSATVQDYLDNEQRLLFLIKKRRTGKKAVEIYNLIHVYYLTD